MKISVKSVKIIESMSEETLCFTAKIYVNGKLAGHAKNHGYGGCTDCYFNDPAIGKAVDEYLSTLPLHKWNFNGEEYSKKRTIDDVIDDLVNDFHNEKENKRINNLGEKHKKNFAEKGYPFTLEVRLPHKVSWTAVMYESMVPKAKEELAKKHQVNIENIKLL